MVYTGKPSRACATCKKRRIKCDEARPACGQCVKSKRECTGYKTEAELMFRDETQATATRAERARHPSSKVSSKESSPEIALIDFAAPIRSSTPSKAARDYSTTDVSKQVSRLAPIAFPYFPLNRGMDNVHLDIAKGYFFNHFILPREYHGFNHFKHVDPMYRNASPDDAISKTAEALSLLSFSRQPAQSFLVPEAAKAYGEAIQTVAKAVADPVKVKDDETLMSILLLSFAETLQRRPNSDPAVNSRCPFPQRKTSVAKFHQAWGTHAYGTQCVLRIRGAEDMLKSPTSASLLVNGRFLVITRHIFCCEPLTDFEQIWQPTVEQESYMHAYVPSIEVAGIGLRLPTLRYRALQCIRRPMAPGVGDALRQLLSDVRDMDCELIGWSYRTRAIRPERVAGYSIRNPDMNIGEEKGYPGRVFTYENLASLNGWNLYRTYRIFLQLMIFNILERLIPPELIDTHHEFIACKDLLQSLVDGVCASLPFAVGYIHTMPLSPTPNLSPKGKFVSPELLSTFTGDFLASERQQQDYLYQRERRSHVDEEHGPAISAWYLIWPLHVSQCAISVDRQTKRWISGRFKFISRTYGIAQADVYSDKAQNVFTPGVAREKMTPFDFAPPLWEPLQ